MSGRGGDGFHWGARRGGWSGGPAGGLEQRRRGAQLQLGAAEPLERDEGPRGAHPAALLPPCSATVPASLLLLLLQLCPPRFLSAPPLPPHPCSPPPAHAAPARPLVQVSTLEASLGQGPWRDVVGSLLAQLMDASPPFPLAGRASWLSKAVTMESALASGSVHAASAPGRRRRPLRWFRRASAAWRGTTGVSSSPTSGAPQRRSKTAATPRSGCSCAEVRRDGRDARERRGGRRRFGPCVGAPGT